MSILKQSEAHFRAHHYHLGQIVLIKKLILAQG